jgi:hypothetical protein
VDVLEWKPHSAVLVPQSARLLLLPVLLQALLPARAQPR